MVSVDGNKISMTRGDTLRVKVSITVDGEQYVPTERDVIRFALKHDTLNSARTEFTDAEPLITVEIPNDSLILELEPSDTKTLGFGKYAYDIQITFADGTVDTFISDRLQLTKEVD